jgi:hypothetical protein
MDDFDRPNGAYTAVVVGFLMLVIICALATVLVR